MNSLPVKWVCTYYDDGIIMEYYTADVSIGEVANVRHYSGEE